MSTKRTISILLCLVMLLAIPCYAFASDDPADGRSAAVYYQTSDALCVFFNNSSGNAAPMKVKTGMFQPEENSYAISRVSEGSTPLTYLILMDSAWTMNAHRKEITGLISAMYNSSITDTLMIVYPYNRDGWRDKDDIYAFGAAEVLNKINGFNFYGTSNSATPYVREILDGLTTLLASRPGGLVNVVLLTDKADSITTEAGEYNSIKEKLDSMPQVLFHCVQFGAAKGALPEFGRGFTFQTDPKGLTAETAGSRINSFVGSLERVVIPQTGIREGSVQLFLQPTEKNSDGTSRFPSSITLPKVPSMVPLLDGEIQSIEQVRETIYDYLSATDVLAQESASLLSDAPSSLDMSTDRDYLSADGG
ncbi:MAG: hypothetical protein J6P58_10015 [Oscillospiraceae bacterium]|nr:hypothetical protein [Oscillospiraceae bacterium]